MFPISRDPPEGGTAEKRRQRYLDQESFPISRDPPEGGTLGLMFGAYPGTNTKLKFPISRDPPEGGTEKRYEVYTRTRRVSNF